MRIKFRVCFSYPFFLASGYIYIGCIIAFLAVGPVIMDTLLLDSETFVPGINLAGGSSTVSIFTAAGSNGRSLFVCSGNSPCVVLAMGSSL